MGMGQNVWIVIGTATKARTGPSDRRTEGRTVVVLEAYSTPEQAQIVAGTLSPVGMVHQRTLHGDTRTYKPERSKVVL